MSKRCSLWFCWRKSAGNINIEYAPGLVQEIALCNRHKDDGMQIAKAHIAKLTPKDGEGK